MLLLTGAWVTAQQVPVPQLKTVFPPGARAGAETEIEVGGANLAGVERLYFSEPGISAVLVSDPAKPPARFKVTVEGGVQPGDCDLRTIGKTGMSNPRAFSIGTTAEINEAEPNDVREKANRAELNTVVNGRISPAQDVDWTVFSAKAGQRVLVECRAWRIDSRLDGMLTLYDAEGKELATSQDENIRDQKRDPFIDFDVPQDGDYYVRLTDFVYAGSVEFFYRLSIGTGPYLDFITPTGAAPGTTAEITCYGRNLSGGEKTDLKVNGRPLEKTVVKIDIPSDPAAVLGLKDRELLRPSASRLDGMGVRVSSGPDTSNSRLLLFSSVPELLESEPNDTQESAQRLLIPSAVTGQFSAPKDADLFVFTAMKNDKLLIEISSERIGSPADPDLEILDSTGKIIQTAQDTAENIGQLRFPTLTRDIIFPFTAPKDGDYTLRVEHAYSQVQGGAQYQYRLEVQKAPLPDFRLICVPEQDLAIDSTVVSLGGKERMDLLVWRMNGYDEPIVVEARNLPAGVTAEPLTIGPGMKSGSLIFTAAPDAPLGEGIIEVTGTGRRGDETLSREARAGGIVWNTANTAAIARLTRGIPLSVRDTAPYSITATAANAVIQIGETLHVNITAERRAGISTSIRLSGAGVVLPPGFIVPTVVIDAGEKEAKMEITTSDKAKAGLYTIFVNAEALIPADEKGDKKIRVVYPSNPLLITVTTPAKK